MTTTSAIRAGSTPAMSARTILVPALAGALLLLAGCDKGKASADLEERVDALESENTDLRAQLEDYKRKSAEQEMALKEASARPVAQPSPTPSVARTPENPATAAQNAAQAAQEVLDAAQM